MNSSQVQFSSSLDEIVLHGTLQRGTGATRSPVLMLTGSGKTDRDETTYADRTFSGKPEKLFKQIADALSECGHPTLRYDKRGVLDEKGTVDREVWKTADREHLIQDAVDAAKSLLQHTGSRPEDLVILGHSEGTILAVETAIALGGKVKGLILMGAQARSMKDMLHYQIVESRTPRSSGTGPQGNPELEYKKALEMIATSREEFAPDDKPMNWYRQYLAAPANAERLLKIQAKVAVFQGKIDPQTPIGELELFAKAGSRDIKIFEYENLGHGFSPDLEGKPTLGPIDSIVLRDICLTANQL